MLFFRKLWVALAGAAAVGLQEFLADSHMTAAELVIFIGMLFAAVGTCIMPNTDELKAAKTWVSALVVGTTILSPLVTGGVTASEWATVAIAVLTTAGVYRVPNKDQYGLVA